MLLAKPSYGRSSMVHFPSYAALALTGNLALWRGGRDQLYLCRFCNAKMYRLPPSYNNVANRRTSVSKISTENYSGKHENSQNPCLYNSLDSKQKARVSLYVDTLLEWNQRMNLTAVTERGAVMERHVEDSLTLLPIMQNAYSKHCVGAESTKLKVVDVGSGAGLPGVILAIACPGKKRLEDRNFRAPEIINLSSSRKGFAAREWKILKDLFQIKDAGQNPGFRETYDIAVARAVADMRVLVEYCLPLVRVGGLLVAAKGYNPQEEVENAKKAIGLMGAFILQLCSVPSEGPHGQRTAVLCLKDRQTPIKYPRQQGLPAKQPL